MKCVVFHDFLIERGGGERVVNILSEFLKAPIVTWFYDKYSTYEDFHRKKIFYHKNFLNKFASQIRILKLFRTFYFFNNQLKNIASFFNKNFDIAIFSGFYSIYFAKFLKIPKVYYIQAEPLTFVLKREFYKREFLNKFYSFFYHFFFKKLEEEAILNMDRIIANSFYMKKIYEEFFRIEVNKVIYPPVDTSKFYFEKYGDFFLLVSRLYPHKRIQIVVDVFKKIPEENLIVIGTGPLANYVKSVAKSYDNIKYVSNISDQKLCKLYANCKAVIYIPEKEHFGIVPIEANASGKIAIISNEGGLPETVIHNKTGVLINAPYKENLLRSIKSIKMKAPVLKECVKNSKRFDRKVFIKNFRRFLNEV